MHEPYSATVLDHYAHPRNLGRLPEADGQGVAGDLADEPAQITIAIRLAPPIAETRIAAARFRAFGCSAAIASASMATVLLEGRTLRDADAITADTITAALGGLPPARRYAPALAATAVQRALADCHARRTAASGIQVCSATEGTMAHTYAPVVRPGQRVSLAKYDPDDVGGLERAEGEHRLQELDRELAELQELLYAAGPGTRNGNSVILLLQGLDTSGKDGTIKRVLKEVNPAGCRIHAFKAPTSRELAHDFLWRIHQHVPAKGELGVFNRSQYEDVLVVRVHDLVPENVWRRRYRQINDFERLLTESGTILVKCFLHISKEEQEERLIEREQDTTKAWKLSPQDWIERRSWDRYTAAYEDALTECSTEHAPWHIIPANKKWFRNLAVAQLLVDALRPHKDEWLGYLNDLGQRQLLAIQEARATHKA